MYRTLAFLSLAAAVRGQGVCKLTAEKRPTISWETCTGPAACTAQTNNIVVDANWRWMHANNASTNCYTGNTWDKTLCPTNAECTANCCVDGADYPGTYGITTSGSSLNINFITKDSGKNIGSRMYLMASDTKYQMFDLLGKEFTFDVDVSKLPCGINGALYFVSMDADGGMAKYPTNKAGAAYGTGYCDAQCARDIKFINGEANVEGWKPSATDVNAGVGTYGTCCPEMDIWEANSMAAAVTTHPCKTLTQRRCKSADCGGSYSEDRYAGDCDPDGCDFNAYRMGVTDFYGKGMKVDTSKVMTVVTQFLTNAAGELAEVKRFYVQDGVVIPQPASAVTGVSGNSLNEPFCKAQKTAFGDTDYHTPRGGLAGMGTALKTGMVLTMSIWDDHYANMLWLDSNDPADSTKMGAKRGACATTSGKPTEVEADNTIKVTFSNIKFGPINSTFKAGPA